jgi:hypothetical protein
MTEREFCFWLNGYFELSRNRRLTKKQVEIIKEHLFLVFNHILPFSQGNDYTKQDGTSGFSGYKGYC